MSLKYFFSDREDYVKRVKVYINYDQETFQKVDKNEAEKQTRLEMSKLCHKFGDGPCVTAKLCKWLMPDGPIKPDNNYVNPKAHKPKKTTLDV